MNDVSAGILMTDVGHVALHLLSLDGSIHMNLVRISLVSIFSASSVEFSF